MIRMDKGSVIVQYISEWFSLLRRWVVFIEEVRRDFAYLQEKHISIMEKLEMLGNADSYLGANEELK